MAGRKECPECRVSVNMENLPTHYARQHPRLELPVGLVREAKAATTTPIGPRGLSPGGVRLLFGGAVVLLLLIAGGFAYATWGNRPPGGSTSGPPVTEMCMQHTNIARHWHARLTITILRVDSPIPTNVGVVSDDCMRPTHTHDATGTIHIEGPAGRDFTLGDFFTVWGQTLSSNQVLTYKADGSHRIQMTVNGTPNSEFRNLVLKDGQQINIEYATV